MRFDLEWNGNHFTIDVLQHVSGQFYVYEITNNDTGNVWSDYGEYTFPHDAICHAVTRIEVWMAEGIAPAERR